MALTGMQRMWNRLFGGFATKHLHPEKYETQLQQARVTLRPEAYLAGAIATALLTFIFTLFLCVTVIILVIPAIGAKVPILVRLAPVFWFVPFLAGFLVYFLAVSDLASRAKKRMKDINLKLPYALNYVAAMASAGVIPTEIFKSLGKQRIYGEVAKESAWIYKDIALHGIDIVTALKRAQDRSPSSKFKEFLQGAITTITSGGDLKNYFLEKAARYQWENRQDQKAFIDTMGLMAETYVTVAVAGPLFMIVMMAIIAIISGKGPSNLTFLVYLMMPVINFGYVFLLNALIPEV